MKKHLCCFCFALFLFLTVRPQQQDSFEIRGVLPWHNFLSGPSAWNEKDYIKYLDDCARNGINFVGFHNYTGGGERYAAYVEPMIRISYKNVVPAAAFDNSQTARWGYCPMNVKDFAFGTSKAFKLPPGAEAFGADCSILSKTTEEHYRSSQKLMQRVLQLAHERKMQVAMGFEFGVLPPEYFSLNNGAGAFYWTGDANMVPNPTHPISIQLMYSAIDDVLAKYPSIDWLWLWLNEHSFMGVDVNRALNDAPFKALYKKDTALFAEAANDEKAKFIGVWSLQYIRLAIEYLKIKAPKVKLIIGGWGGGNQLPLILKGLDRGLPKDVVFSCLNPALGQEAQPDFLADIARNRKVFAMPWLEGDHQLWHYQPRVQLMRDHVKLASKQKLHGVVAIHWRTKETAFNFNSFAHFARQPNDTMSVHTLYKNYLQKSCGVLAASKLADLFIEMDTAHYRRGIASPEYFGYSPQWGKMSDQAKSKAAQLVKQIDAVLPAVSNPHQKSSLTWFKQTFTFELLLDEVSRAIEPAFKLRNKYLQAGLQYRDAEALRTAQAAFKQAPVEQLFKTFAAKVSSRGELGELSSLNQKLWTEYLQLQSFLTNEEKAAVKK
jgi:hypothetical protein